MNDVDENFNYASGGNDDEQFIQNEKLKEELRKSLLVEVGKIVEHEKNSEQGAFETLDDEKLQIDKSVVHALTECLFQHAGTMTKDMFAFAKHVWTHTSWCIWRDNFLISVGGFLDVLANHALLHDCVLS